MSEDKFNFDVDDNSPIKGPITILKGVAPNPQNPHSVTINGRLDAPGNYFEKRDVDRKDAHVVANYKDRYVTLVILPNYPDQTVTVSGGLSLDHRLEQFGINTDKKYDRDSLSLLCKFNRAHFTTMTEGTELVKKLRDFKIRFNQSLEADNDQRGNQKVLMERVIKECDLPDGFTLFLPIFSGEDKTRIEVDLLFEVASSGDVVFWLESPELQEKIEEQTQALIDHEVERMNELVIIYR